MMELARAIAVFVRQAGGKATVERVGRSDACVVMGDGYRLNVTWRKGGAVVSHTFFARGITGYNYTAIAEHVTTLIKQRAERKEKEASEAFCIQQVKLLNDAAKNDPRVRVSYERWDRRPYALTFHTQDFTALSMLTDYIVENVHDGEGPMTRPTLATATYNFCGASPVTLREIANDNALPEETWNAVLAMAVGDVVTFSGGDIIRIS